MDIPLELLQSPKDLYYRQGFLGFWLNYDTDIFWWAIFLHRIEFYVSGAQTYVFGRKTYILGTVIYVLGAET